MDDVKLKASIIEAHAAQLRADVLRELYEAGEDWTELLQEKIYEIMDSDKPNLALVGKLAEIGMCAVMTEAAGVLD